jgi:hypothetical protein
MASESTAKERLQRANNIIMVALVHVKTIRGIFSGHSRGLAV